VKIRYPLLLIHYLLISCILFGASLPLEAGGKKDQEFQILNAHEHIQSIQEVPRFLEAMKQNGIVTTVILGSSNATFILGGKGFKGWEENNLEIIRIANEHPGQFLAFPTLDPKDPEKLQKLQAYLQQGAKGLKLYSGNKLFHDQPLDAPSMLAVYAYCEKQNVPIMFHVNAGYFQHEFENVLKQFPHLKVICPHFCLSTIKSERFEYLMDTYPQLYTDVSFGYMDFLIAGLRRFSKNPEKYRALVTKYQDRILFGTDLVVSDGEGKSTDRLTQVARAYRDMLEKEQYTFFALPGEPLRGLHLDREILQKIYHENFIRFFSNSSQSKESQPD
jgi:predicted TIM-barrel fold metal-dependent hydrolase